MTLHAACSIFEEVGVLQDCIEEDVTSVHVLAGDHPEDAKALRTVCQGQFNFHAVVIGIGEDAVLRKFVQAECKVKLALTLLRRRQIYSYILYRRPLLQRCLLSVYRQYHKIAVDLLNAKVNQPRML